MQDPRPAGPPPGSRLKQWLVALLGAALCVVMLGLGLWQMQVFEDREDASAAARAEEPPVPLLPLVNSDGTVGDVYGRQVLVEGRYRPGQEVMVVAEDQSVRVLSAFQLDDGRVLAVVRGTLGTVTAPAPPPPAGKLRQGGVFLPSEPGADHAVPPDTLGSVRLPALAQDWPQQLLPGFITLSQADAQAQGLIPAALALPSGEGSVQNIGYALQWWVFAAFGAFMTVRFVRTLGQQGSLGTLSEEEDQ